jgi:thiosulfate dehydrogenase [quinone] large subunit
MRNIREIAYALLRITLGVIFLFAGVTKFMAGIGNIAREIVRNFAGKLPAALVQPFAYALPFAEVTLGALILLGLFVPVALLFSGLLLIVLNFGLVMAGDTETVAHNLQYALINFVLLWLCDVNLFSLDRLLKRSSTMGIT